jgi:CubicO group peptidase (beta-lactamase class C family)
MTTLAEVGAWIEQALLAERVASLAVAVVQGGETLWEAGFGWADREARRPATPHTVYAVASISKPMTATAIMALVERGDIDLDAPINDYLGDVPLRAWVGDACEATVRRVLSHSAGLPPHCQFFYADEPRACPPMPETIRRYGQIVTRPGVRYCYSNLGYGLLDYLITRQSDGAYADLMREEIFWPLGLTHTTLEIDDALTPYKAAAYTPSGYRLPPFGFSHTGGSAIFASAHDLARFGMAHLGLELSGAAPILSEESRAAMGKPMIPIDERAHYALGWSVIPDDQGYRILGHDGYMSGASARLRLVPEKEVVVAVVTNGQGSLYKEATNRVLAAVLPDYTLRASEQEEVDSNWIPVPELAGAWAGEVYTYQGQMPLWVDFQPDGDVHAQLGDQWKTLLSEPSYTREEGFSAQMMGRLDTPDARGHHQLQVRLWFQGEETLQGMCIASSRPGADGRMRDTLSHPAILRRS